MSYETRKKLYEKLVKKRKRPLIVYVTSIRSKMGAQMAGDAIRPIIDQINLIPKEEKKIDFLIVSNGGDAITALRIISLLRERFDNIAVLLPYVAYSAATILSLGADTIVMHPYSNLGPVDPQLTVSHKDNIGNPEQICFSSEDLVNYIDFIKRDVGIKKQEYLADTTQLLIKDVGSLSIGSAKRSQMLSRSLSERMLSSHIEDTDKVKSITKALNYSYYHHGYAVGRKEANEIGLPVEIPDKLTEKLLWDIWVDFEEEMKCNDEFSPIKEIMSDPNTGDAIKTIPVLNMPVDLPPEIKQEVFKQVISKIQIVSRFSIKISPIIACVESLGKAQAFYNEINILYWRDTNANLMYNMTNVPSGWVNYKGKC